MKDKIREVLLYYQQFHHTLVGWQITIAGFVFVALLAADVQSIASDSFTKWAVAFAIIVFPSLFMAAIAQYGCRIERLNNYLESNENPPDTWIVEHKKIGFTVAGAGSWYFLGIIVAQTMINLLLAYTRLWSSAPLPTITP